LRLRRHERPLLALALLLVGLLAILLGPVGVLSAPRAADPSPQGPQGATPCAHAARGAGQASAAVVSWDGDLAVAADRAGSFWLYGLPDPETGHPTERSYDVLVACTNERLPANQAALSVSGGGTERAGPGALARPTERQSDGTLKTVYAFSGAITMEQRLSVEGEDLVISYRVTNRSDAARRISLRSVLTPPEGGLLDPAFVAPASYNAAERPFGMRIWRETRIPSTEVGPVEVPRRGAPSDSSGRWGPASGPEPDLLAFASSGELLSGPFAFAPEGARLPPASSMAAYWLGARLAPGEDLTLSERYETPATAADAPKGAL
jgi:hypothetical protein